MSKPTTNNRLFDISGRTTLYTRMTRPQLRKSQNIEGKRQRERSSESSETFLSLTYTWAYSAVKLSCLLMIEYCLEKFLQVKPWMLAYNWENLYKLIKWKGVWKILSTDPRILSSWHIYCNTYLWSYSNLSQGSENIDFSVKIPWLLCSILTLSEACQWKHVTVLTSLKL